MPRLCRLRTEERGDRMADVNEAAFRFYAELNDLLSPPKRRATEIPFRFHVSPTVKDAIESLGIPHVEVSLILVNGASVGFDHRLSDRDRVSVYPIFRRLDPQPTVRLRETVGPSPTFVADVHLRRLARFLRLLGFDALHSSEADDATLIELSAGEGRVLLSRDRQLLKHGRLIHGYWVRSTDPVQQARETVRRFDLSDKARPFSRCPVCNGELETVDKASVAQTIPPKTARWLDKYVQCAVCGKLYWRGTHFDRLESLVSRILDEADHA